MNSPISEIMSNVHILPNDEICPNYEEYNEENHLGYEEYDDLIRKGTIYLRDDTYYYEGEEYYEGEDCDHEFNLGNIISMVNKAKEEGKKVDLWNTFKEACEYEEIEIIDYILSLGNYGFSGQPDEHIEELIDGALCEKVFEIDENQKFNEDFIKYLASLSGDHKDSLLSCCRPNGNRKLLDLIMCICKENLQMKEPLLIQAVDYKNIDMVKHIIGTYGARDIEGALKKAKEVDDKGDIVRYLEGLLKVPRARM